MNRRKKSLLWVAAIPSIPAILACGFVFGVFTQHGRGHSNAYRVSGISMSPTLVDGTICVLQRPQSPFAIGDVVAVRWAGNQRIKRIVAMGGDIVDCSDGRLVVNGQRIEDIVANRDKRRFIPPAELLVSERRNDWIRDSEQPEWLVFRYQNPHSGNRETSVMDDYPQNKHVVRTLNEVDRLSVRLESNQGQRSSAARFDIGMRSEEGYCLGKLILGRAFCTQDGKPCSQIPCLDSPRQVAIHVGASELTDLRLKVHRQIEYRDDRRLKKVSYPLTLKPNEFFLLGDNVPVSIDSRELGPVTEDQIIGTLEVFEMD